MALHPFLQGLKPTLHIAHRGGSSLFPENTLLAFRQALERFRTDVLETDVHRTRDGVLVISHDPTVDRCTDGSGAIADLTLAEVRSLNAGYRFTPDDGRTFPFRDQGLRIPTLRETLEAFPATRFNIDVKEDGPSIERDFANELKRAGAVSRVCPGSEWDALSAKLFDALPDACHFYPRDALANFIIPLLQGEAPAEDARFTVLDMPLYFQGMRLLGEPLLSATRARGKWINVWTIDDEAEMEQLVAEGVGGIMTDRPDLLRAVLDRKR